MPRIATTARALAPLGIFLLLLASSALAAEIAVSAGGVAYGVPDVATLEVGFTTTDADVADALERADTAIAAVRAALEAHGVDPLDMRTTTYAVWREERFEERRETSVVYRVTHHLHVTVRDVDAVGPLIVAATGSGANVIGGVAFMVDDPRVLETAAREEAFVAARRKAEELARLGGLDLGSVTSVVEATARGPAMGAMERSVVVFADAGAPIAAGRLAVEVHLEVRYEASPR